ncbi:MAG TPA: hypothetical protein VIL30_16785, partial [Ramlibacter sp.]
GDAMFFPDGVTTDWQMRPAIKSDTPPGAQHRHGLMVLVRHWPGLTTYYQFFMAPPMRRKPTQSNIRWALKRELRRDREFRKAMAQLDTLAASKSTL